MGQPTALPADLVAALAETPAADVAFRRLSPSHQGEYLDWIAEAKKPETRARRIAKTLQMVLGTTE
jgi:uncharacterized protein YdeI (YjbR/CyaY-like superfamily)